MCDYKLPSEAEGSPVVGIWRASGLIAPPAAPAYVAMDELLTSTVVIAKPERAAVSRSVPDIPKAPSPMRLPYPPNARQGKKEMRSTLVFVAGELKFDFGIRIFGRSDKSTIRLKLIGKFLAGNSDFLLRFPTISRRVHFLYGLFSNE